ncbi:phage protein Gp36 family protein [Alienimonas sp. DA493]|uniref:phage protein Gp36 family protein n=1 Tax=Alienimonas sp. DA493 TaxID=3373605 RepID=UPI0037545EFC
MTAFCTAADVESVLGPELYAGAAGYGYGSSSADSQIVEDAIARQSARISRLLGHRYDDATLAANQSVRWATAELAAADLTSRNGNPPAAGLKQRTEEIVEWTKTVAAGSADLAGSNSDAASVPSLSVPARVRLDPRRAHLPDYEGRPYVPAGG